MISTLEQLDEMLGNEVETFGDVVLVRDQQCAWAMYAADREAAFASWGWDEEDPVILDEILIAAESEYPIASINAAERGTAATRIDIARKVARGLADSPSWIDRDNAASWSEYADELAAEA